VRLGGISLAGRVGPVCPLAILHESWRNEESHVAECKVKQCAARRKHQSKMVSTEELGTTQCCPDEQIETRQHLPNDIDAALAAAPSKLGFCADKYYFVSEGAQLVSKGVARTLQRAFFFVRPFLLSRTACNERFKLEEAKKGATCSCR